MIIYNAKLVAFRITEAQGNRECQRHSKEAGEETKAVINRVKR